MPTTEIQKLPKEPSALFGNQEVAFEPRFLPIPPSLSLPPERTLAISARAVLPDHILLGTLRDGRLRVQSPINVKIAKENQHVIAEATELDEFGFGANLSEALHDLQRAIVELYFTLEAERDRLGPDLQRVWTTLQAKLLRRP